MTIKMTPQQSLEWIRSRRSVFPKEFDGGEISDEHILQLLEAARWAPSHKLTEPWRFQVFRGDVRMELAEVQVKALLTDKVASPELQQKADKFLFIAGKSAAVVAVIMHRDPLQRVSVNDELWAVACAVQNIQLHANSLKLGMYWSTGAATNTRAVRDYLELAEHDVHMGYLYIGTYSHEKQARKERKDLSEILVWR